MHACPNFILRSCNAPYAHLIYNSVKEIHRVALLQQRPKEHRGLRVVVLCAFLLGGPQTAVDIEVGVAVLVACRHVVEHAWSQHVSALQPPGGHLAVKEHVSSWLQAHHVLPPLAAVVLGHERVHLGGVRRPHPHLEGEGRRARELQAAAGQQLHVLRLLAVQLHGAPKRLRGRARLPRARGVLLHRPQLVQALLQRARQRGG
mmetsp:Transcript_43675/g.83348  ORF Transcript_43675/g.83348 Transcript_43675/m.83348 type:complete len:203 (-) Transcript_43675:474-1082(-)